MLPHIDYRWCFNKIQQTHIYNLLVGNLVFSKLHQGVILSRLCHTICSFLILNQACLYSRTVIKMKYVSEVIVCISIYDQISTSMARFHISIIHSAIFIIYQSNLSLLICTLTCFIPIEDILCTLNMTTDYSVYLIEI